MKIKSEMHIYMDKYIKSIVVERHGNKFYGTLTDKEGRTFEFSKDAIDIERFFDNTHKTLCENTDIKKNMLVNCFQKLFIGTYESRRAFGNLEIGSTI
jgi:hypothetical protein